MSDTGWQADRRRAFRAFVRTHHPDVGGDPEEFAAGVASFRRGPVRSSVRPDRFDAPVVVVTRRRGLFGIVQRAWTWWSRRRRGPRVR